MPEYHPLIEIIVTSIVLAFIFGFIAKSLKLPALLGYLVAGVMIGPHTPGFVGDAHLSAQLAEIGVILLMFSVGLHFSPKDLFSVGRIAIPGAIVQIFSAIILGTILALLCGFSFIQGVVFSIPLSVASTVVLLRTLEQRHLLMTPSGKISVGWLVVEDIMMVLAIVLLPVLADISLSDKDVSVGAVGLDMLWILFKIFTFAILMFVIGRKILPGLIFSIVKIKSRELTSLAILSIALGFAYAAYKYFDASFALGAFLAGLVLNESEVGSKTAQQHLPLKDIFAVLFFVSVGMLFDPMVVLKHPVIVITGVLVVVVGKSMAAYGIMRMFSQSRETSLIVAASLAQIGEFSFIFAGMARNFKLLPATLYDVILACALISISINPLVFNLVKFMTSKNDPDLMLIDMTHDNDHIHE
ncbi:MAG TPA: cation:proton antiporter [Alphaproteobacteria bacterium]